MQLYTVRITPASVKVECAIQPRAISHNMFTFLFSLLLIGSESDALIFIVYTVYTVCTLRCKIVVYIHIPFLYIFIVLLHIYILYIYFFICILCWHCTLGTAAYNLVPVTMTNKASRSLKKRSPFIPKWPPCHSKMAAGLLVSRGRTYRIQNGRRDSHSKMADYSRFQR